MYRFYIKLKNGEELIESGDNIQEVLERNNLDIEDVLSFVRDENKIY